MITKVRIDERLIHGEIVFSWRGAINFDSIIVVSDSVANNDLRKAALRMGCPPDIKIAIRSVDDAIKLIADPRMDKYKSLVLFEEPVAALQFYQGIDQRPSLNLGYMSADDTKGRRVLAGGVYATSEELDAILRIRDMGIAVDIQRVPTQPAVDLDRAVAKFNKR